MAIDLIFVIILVISIGVAVVIGYLLGQKLRDHYWQGQIPDIRAEAIQRSRSVLAGQFSEQLAPYLPNFPWSPSEARFIGKPVDFIIFKGADEKEISEVIFVEVKSGKSSLNPQERNLRDVIKDKKVNWAEYRIPEDLTKRKTDELPQ